MPRKSSLPLLAPPPLIWTGTMVEPYWCLFSHAGPRTQVPCWSWKSPTVEFQEHFTVTGFVPGNELCLDLCFGSLLRAHNCSLKGKRVRFPLACSSPFWNSAPSSLQHTPTRSPDWPAPNTTTFKICSLHGPSLGANILGRASLGQALASIATWTQSGHYPEIINLLPSRTKKSVPRRRILTSTFRVSGSQFLEDFKYILFLILPSSVQKRWDIVSWHPTAINICVLNHLKSEYLCSCLFIFLFVYSYQAGSRSADFKCLKCWTPHTLTVWRKDGMCVSSCACESEFARCMCERECAWEWTHVSAKSQAGSGCWRNPRGPSYWVVKGREK